MNNLGLKPQSGKFTNLFLFEHLKLVHFEIVDKRSHILYVYSCVLTRPCPVLVSGSAGAPRYSAPTYVPMVRPPVFTPRPPIGPPPVPMVLPRPPGPRPMPPVLKPPPGMMLNEFASKGVGQIAAPPEKPHTTVYVGKIAPTIEDEFLRAILEVSISILV